MTLKKINLFIRSLLFSIYSISSILIYSLVVASSIILPWPWRVKIIKVYLTAYFFMLKWLCNIDVKIDGLENIPKDRNGVVLCKHQSTWETFYVPPLFNIPVVILKRELMWIPFFGWALIACNPIAINRGNKSSAMQQILEKGKIALDSGRWVMMFPEGTRTAPGTVGHYKLGGARLATATGYPVLPIAHNAGRFWPRRKFIKRPGTIHVVIGPLIESKGQTAEAVLDQAKTWIEETMVRIDKE
jgi:1-acyl-sn-glycerol-3-phosphate acyltransferase